MIKIRKRNKLRQRDQGQGLVEFALLIPLLVLIVFGAVDLARAYFAQVTITNASREGARYAMRINGDPGTAAAKLALIKQRVIDEASYSLAILDSDITVNCSGGAYVSPCGSGNDIRVTVYYDFDLVMGAYFIPSITLSHYTEMVAP
jgi:Flp pilus assembly protein TadG